MPFGSQARRTHTAAVLDLGARDENVVFSGEAFALTRLEEKQLFERVDIGPLTRMLNVSVSDFYLIVDEMWAERGRVEDPVTELVIMARRAMDARNVPRLRVERRAGL